VTERSARRVRTFDIEGRRRPAVSVGGSDHFGLPAIAPGLREVNAYLGWFGPMSRAMQVSSAMGAAVAAVPGTRALARRLTGRFVKGSTGGPSAEERAKVRSHIAAIAYDASGRALAEVHVAGVDGYTYTGAMLAWSAARAAAGDLQAAGALGPVQAFGLRALEAGSAEAGISQVTAQQPAATAVG
jgi:short subunit dehydrogenase-like uncharacterized protein